MIVNEHIIVNKEDWHAIFFKAFGKLMITVDKTIQFPFQYVNAVLHSFRINYQTTMTKDITILSALDHLDSLSSFNILKQTKKHKNCQKEFVKILYLNNVPLPDEE